VQPTVPNGSSTTVWPLIVIASLLVRLVFETPSAGGAKPPPRALKVSALVRSLEPALTTSSTDPAARPPRPPLRPLDDEPPPPDVAPPLLVVAPPPLDPEAPLEPPDPAPLDLAPPVEPLDLAPLDLKRLVEALDLAPPVEPLDLAPPVQERLVVVPPDPKPLVQSRPEGAEPQELQLRQLALPPPARSAAVPPTRSTPPLSLSPSELL